MSFRCLIGISAGITISTEKSYFAEILPKANRGKFMQISHFSFIAGAIYVVSCAILICPELDDPTANWRALCLVAAIPNIIPLVFCWLLPESPYYTANTGCKEEAKLIFNRIFERNKQERLTEEEKQIIDN